MIDRAAKRLQVFDSKANRVLGMVAGVLAFVGMFLVTFDVGGRYLFNHPIPGTLERTEAMLCIIVFWSITYWEITKGHLRMTLLYSRFSPRWRLSCDILTKVLVLFLFSFLIWQTFLYGVDSWVNRETDLLGVVPLWLPKFGIFIGCVAFFLHFLGGFVLQVINMIRRTA